MTPAEFESRLMQCLDERRDPFVDAELADHLATDPEAAVRVADLCARLEVVAGVLAKNAPSVVDARWRTRRATSLRLAAAAVLLAAVAFAAFGSHRPSTESPGRVLRAHLATVGDRPLAATVTVRTVLARERGLSLQTFDQRVVRR